MNVNEYLLKHQPIIYRSFCNAIKYNRLSHAYLLVGNQGAPLIETATFLAKSLLCDNPSPLACDNCITCLRIDDGNYADFLIVNGSKGTIKKEDVTKIMEACEKTALEAKGRLVYIIHQVENMTSEAVNALLKFLEEPGKEIYAFLTTENEIKVLPTIISRTQKLLLRPINQENVINEAIEKGIAEDDAQLLSFFYTDASLIDKYVDEGDYLYSKEYALSTIESLLKSSREAAFYIQSVVSNKLKTKEQVRFYLDILQVLFSEILKIKSNASTIITSYDRIFKELSSKVSNIEDILQEIMITRGRIDLNLSLGSLLDHIAFTFIKGDE